MVGHGGFGTPAGRAAGRRPAGRRPAVRRPALQRRADRRPPRRPHRPLRRTPRSVRAAVERVLAEPAFRFAAGRVALEAQGLPSIDAAPRPVRSEGYSSL